jgi:hypothetical protein
MKKSFSERARFDEDLSRWNVTDMSYMFNVATQFKSSVETERNFPCFALLC